MREPWITDTEPSRRYPHYTRANAGEVLPDPVTPLGWTFVWEQAFLPGWCDGNEATGAFAEGELDRARPQDVGGIFNGYYYINLSCMRMHGVRNPGVSLEQLEAGLLGAHPDVPPYVPHPDDDRPDRAPAIAAHTRWMTTTTEWPELDTDRDAVAELRRTRPELTSIDGCELVARARAVQSVLRQAFARHTVSSFGAAMSPAVLAAIGETLGRPDLPTTLLAGFGDIESARPVLAQWELSRVIRSSASLTALFDDGPDAVLAALTEAGQVADFADRWRRYLAEHGYRGPSEWELMANSYETDPRLGLVALDSIRRQADAQSPRARAEGHRETRDRTVAEVRSELAGDSEAAALFDAALHAARFIGWRERTKSTAVRAMNEARVAFHELSRRGVGRAELEDARDLYMLTADELDTYLLAPGQMRDELAARRVDWLGLFELQPPFIIADGRVPPVHTWVRQGEVVDATAVAGTVLRGISGSAGTATGRARVITDPFDDHRLQPGDILVAANTDPSWTPLFLVAGAVVVDTGSQISHSVVVSRELGLPCAIAVTGATTTIPDGAVVTVDGSAGTVRIEGVHP